MHTELNQGHTNSSKYGAHHRVRQMAKSEEVNKW